MNRRFLAWGLLVTLLLGGSAAVGTAVKAYVEPRRKSYNTWATTTAAGPTAAVRHDLTNAGAVKYAKPRVPNEFEAAEFATVIGYLKDMPDQPWMLDQTFHPKRIGEELARLGWYRATGRAATDVQLQADGGAFVDKLRQANGQKKWPVRYFGVTVTHAAVGPNGKEAVLTVAGLKAEAEGTDYFRVWVVKDPAGPFNWQVFDFDEPETHIRYTSRFAATFGGPAGGGGGVTPPGSSIYFGAEDDPPVLALRLAFAAAAAGNAAETRRHLSVTYRHLMTPVLQAVQHVAASRMHLLDGNPAQASVSLSNAEATWPDTPAIHPARAALAMAQNKPDEARKHVAAYRAMGLDSAEMVVIAAALAGPAGADAEFRRGQPHFPSDARLYAAWAKLSPKSAAAAATALAARPNHDVLLPHVLDLCGPDHAAAFAAEFRRATPQDATGLIESAAIELKAGKADAAATLVKKAVELTEGKPEKVAGLYAARAIAAGKAVEAYKHLAAAGAKREAFDAVGGQLRLNLTAANAKALLTVADARAAADTKSHFPHAYKADAHFALADYAAAAAALADAMKRLPDMDDAAWEPCRAKRCECLFKLGKWEQALAEVGPVPATYAQLATLLADAKDAAGLEQLVTKHSAKNPEIDPKHLKAEVAHLRKDSAAVLTLTADTRETGWTPEDVWANRAMRRRVRALVRLNNMAEAKPFSERVGGLMPAWVRLVNALKEEDAAEAAKAMNQFLAGGGTVAMVYADDDLSPLTASPRLAKFRQQYPKPK